MHPKPAPSLSLALLQTDCEPHCNHAHCAATVMPEARAEVTFDSLGEAAGDTWSGALTFVEVEIASDHSPPPLRGGDVFELASWSFETELSAS